MENDSMLDSPYWTEVLSFAKDGNNKTIETMSIADKKSQERFLRLFIEAYLPFTVSSPQAFKRVSELSENKETKSIANLIYEIEMGKHPLVKGAPHHGIPHHKQFVHWVKSLGSGITINVPEKSKIKALQQLDLPNAPLIHALAACDVIEHTAPEIFFYFQDFLAQWQFFTKRKTKDINRAFIDEHSLTEGDQSPEQHIGLVDKLVRPHKDLTETQKYDEAKKNYHKVMLNHLNDTYKKIKEIT